ncbi:MAG: hypothetical protein IPP04_06965 [Saprospiraceae bacterium]|nr:hypothetical protein [Saprospiraceae bacterium]
MKTQANQSIRLTNQVILNAIQSFVAFLWSFLIPGRKAIDTKKVRGIWAGKAYEAAFKASSDLKTILEGYVADVQKLFQSSISEVEAKIEKFSIKLKAVANDIKMFDFEREAHLYYETTAKARNEIRAKLLEGLSVSRDRLLEKKEEIGSTKNAIVNLLTSRYNNMAPVKHFFWDTAKSIVILVVLLTLGETALLGPAIIKLDLFGSNVISYCMAMSLSIFMGIMIKLFGESVAFGRSALAFLYLFGAISIILINVGIRIHTGSDNILILTALNSIYAYIGIAMAIRAYRNTPYFTLFEYNKTLLQDQDKLLKEVALYEQKLSFIDVPFQGDALNSAATKLQDLKNLEAITAETLSLEKNRLGELQKIMQSTIDLGRSAIKQSFEAGSSRSGSSNSAFYGVTILLLALSCFSCTPNMTPTEEIIALVFDKSKSVESKDFPTEVEIYSYIERCLNSGNNNNFSTKTIRVFFTSVGETSIREIEQCSLEIPNYLNRDENAFIPKKKAFENDVKQRISKYTSAVNKEGKSRINRSICEITNVIRSFQGKKTILVFSDFIEEGSSISLAKEFTGQNNKITDEKYTKWAEALNAENEYSDDFTNNTIIGIWKPNIGDDALADQCRSFFRKYYSSKGAKIDFRAGLKSL